MSPSNERRRAAVDRREVPIHPVAVAAHYVRVPASTLLTWVAGRPATDDRGAAKPIIALAQSEPRLLSFSNLVEAFVLAAMRRAHGIPLQRVRRALDYVGDKLGVERPLVNQTFRTDGVDLFVERYGKLLNVSRAGQVTMRDALTSSLKRIDWDGEGLAARLYPWVRSGAGEQPRTIVIDPARAFGKPALKGTGIPTEIVAERYRAGESIDELVTDYGVAPALIEDALRCEWREAS